MHSAACRRLPLHRAAAHARPCQFGAARRNMAIASAMIQKSDEVAQALHDGKAVVALESTIISHGMPYPENVETAMELEGIVREGGCVPATVAIMDGQVCAGLAPAQLERLGKLGREVQKCSRRDIAPVVAQGKCGATTVAGTMVVAAGAGIRVFATGGLGGVHRGVEDTMDISADLMELGRTRVAVVCAGVKSILDIPRTLEVLETQGVTVAALGAANFPAFFTPDSGLPAPMTLKDEAEAAALLLAAEQLDVQSGSVIAVPNPEPGNAADIEAAVQRALTEATAQGIAGRDMTPFLLQRVNELTQGASLRANIALVRNNARVGAGIARRFANLQGQPRRSFSSTAAARSGATQRMQAAIERVAAGGVPALGSLVPHRGKHPVVVGGAVVDLTARPAAGCSLTMASSTPGQVEQSFGGVGRNVAEGLARLHRQPVLLTEAGGDALGSALLEHAKSLGITTAVASALVGGESAGKTGVYNAVLDEDGDLVAAVADMAAMDAVSPATVQSIVNYVNAAPMVVVDGNVPTDTIEMLCEASCIAGASWAFVDAAEEALQASASPAEPAAEVTMDDFLAEGGPPGVPVWFEPTSVAKATKAATPWTLAQLAVISPNADECIAMAEALHEHLEGQGAVGRDQDAPESAATSGSSPGGLSLDGASFTLDGMQLADVDWDSREVADKLAERGVSPAEMKEFVRAHTKLNADGSVDISLPSALGSGPDVESEGSRSPHEESDDDELTPAALRGLKDPADAHAVEGDAEKYTAFTVSAEGGQTQHSFHHGVKGDATHRTLHADDSADGSVMRLDGELLTCAQRLLAAMCHPACVQRNAGLVQGCKHVVITLGKWGVLWLSSPPLTSAEHFLAMCNLPFFEASIQTGFDFHLFLPPPSDMVNCTGAGDTLVAGTVAALCQGRDMGTALQYGMGAARATIRSASAVAPDLSPTSWQAEYEAVRDWNTVPEPRGGPSSGKSQAQQQWGAVRQRLQQALQKGELQGEEAEAAEEVRMLAEAAAEGEAALASYTAEALHCSHANASFLGKYEAELAGSPLPQLTQSGAQAALEDR